MTADSIPAERDTTTRRRVLPVVGVAAGRRRGGRNRDRPGRGTRRVRRERGWVARVGFGDNLGTRSFLNRSCDTTRCHDADPYRRVGRPGRGA